MDISRATAKEIVEMVMGELEQRRPFKHDLVDMQNKHPDEYEEMITNMENSIIGAMKTIKPRDPLLAAFDVEYSGMPDEFISMSQTFLEMAEHLTETLETGTKRDDAIQALILARDAAIRALGIEYPFKHVK